jgi:hypothetical protein
MLLPRRLVAISVERSFDDEPVRMNLAFSESCTRRTKRSQPATFWMSRGGFPHLSLSSLWPRLRAVQGAGHPVPCRCVQSTITDREAEPQSEDIVA